VEELLQVVGDRLDLPEVLQQPSHGIAEGEHEPGPSLDAVEGPEDRVDPLRLGGGLQVDQGRLRRGEGVAGLRPEVLQGLGDEPRVQLEAVQDHRPELAVGGRLRRDGGLRLPGGELRRLRSLRPGEPLDCGQMAPHVGEEGLLLGEGGLGAEAADQVRGAQDRVHHVPSHRGPLDEAGAHQRLRGVGDPLDQPPFHEAREPLDRVKGPE
jgi:hypothetical protein